MALIEANLDERDVRVNKRTENKSASDALNETENKITWEASSTKTPEKKKRFKAPAPRHVAQITFVHE